jgi:hypothetical protein
MGSAGSEVAIPLGDDVHRRFLPSPSSRPFGAGRTVKIACLAPLVALR